MTTWFKKKNCNKYGSSSPFSVTSTSHTLFIKTKLESCYKTMVWPWEWRQCTLMCKYIPKKKERERNVSCFPTFQNAYTTAIWKVNFSKSGIISTQSINGFNTFKNAELNMKSCLTQFSLFKSLQIVFLYISLRLMKELHYWSTSGEPQWKKQLLHMIYIYMIHRLL